MNLLSAVLDATAVAVVFLIVYRLVWFGRERAAALTMWTVGLAAAVGALLLAFSTVFWSYSVVAEVFALNNVLAALLLLVGLEWARRPDRVRLVWLFAFLLGLALTNQHTIVLLAPAIAVLAWAGWSRLRRAAPSARRPLRRRALDVAIACGLFVVGLLPYLYLPIAAAGDPPVNWGDPRTFHRFVQDVTRADYGTFRLTNGKSGSRGEQLQLLFGNLTRGFVVVGVVLAVLGLWWTWRNARAEGIALALAFLFAGPIFALYSNTYFPDELTKGVVARFYILPSIPLAILAGAGAWQVLLWAERVGSPRLRPGIAALVAGAALLVVPVASAVTHFDTADQRGNRFALHYAQDVLGPLAPNAVLLMRSDENFTSVYYAQNVAHFRRDIVALDAELLKLPSYVDQVRRQHPEIVIPFDSYDGGVDTSLNDLVQANIGRRPVYSVGAMEEKDFGSGFDKLKEGFSLRLLTKGEAPDEYAALRRDAARFARFHYPERSYPADSWETALESNYAGVALDLGYALQSGGVNAPLAESMFRKAIRLAPNLAPAYKDLGLLLRDNGGDPRETIALWERFLRLRPNDKDAGAIRAAIAQLKAGR